MGALAWRPKPTVFVAGTVAVGLNFFFVSPSLNGWQAVNTNLGAVSDEQSSALTQFEAAEFVQRQALASNAHVIVFPEAVVPSWTPATDWFWEDTVNKLRSSGKTIIVGAKVPETQPASAFSSDDFALSLATLQSAPAGPRVSPPSGADTVPAYRNVLVVRGQENTMFEQRVPVPISMWRPFTTGGVQLRLTGPAILPVEGQRVAVLICYEQLLTWPILTALIGKPTVIVAVANDYWARGTTVPEFQRSAVRAWARLMSIPYVSATNL
jgi:predicted amidohydrolase